MTQVHGRQLRVSPIDEHVLAVALRGGMRPWRILGGGDDRSGDARRGNPKSTSTPAWQLPFGVGLSHPLTEQGKSSSPMAAAARRDSATAHRAAGRTAGPFTSVAARCGQRHPCVESGVIGLALRALFAAPGCTR